jgi:hypothetical protein
MSVGISEMEAREIIYQILKGKIKNYIKIIR